MERMPESLVLLWDVDGVLVDTERLHFEAWQELFRARFGKALTLDEYRSCIGRGGDENMRYLLKLKGVRGDVEALRVERRRDYEELRAKGIPLITENIALVRQFREAYPEIRRVAVSSATCADIRGNLAAAGLENFFEVAVSFEDVPGMRRKPEPDIYLHALRVARVRASRCIAFEDSLSGVLSAKAAGIRCVALPNELTAGQDFRGTTLVIPPGSPRSVQGIMQMVGM
jgi:beta-phosphoglucomutase-like phosphatase (HAD superfamily)